MKRSENKERLGKDSSFLQSTELVQNFKITSIVIKKQFKLNQAILAQQKSLKDKKNQFGVPLVDLFWLTPGYSPKLWKISVQAFDDIFNGLFSSDFQIGNPKQSVVPFWFY